MTDTASTASGLTVSPEASLAFNLSRQNEPTTATLTLSCASTETNYFCFKVKTTQPKRYLVRPNQGLVAPGNSEVVTIILVDKDKNQLVQEHEQLGAKAGKDKTDKFLIQSSVITKERYDSMRDFNQKELPEQLTNMWIKIAEEEKLGKEKGFDSKVVNRKLQVIHTVVDGGGSSSASSSGYGSVQQSADRMREQMAVKSASQSTSPTNASSSSAGNANTAEHQFMENVALKKKYDELVAFSVTLTSERDILNNALEQAKRDLHKEMTARIHAEESTPPPPKINSQQGQVKTSAADAGAQSKKYSFFQLLVLVIISFFLGKFVNGSTSMKVGLNMMDGRGEM